MSEHQEQEQIECEPSGGGADLGVAHCRVPLAGKVLADQLTASGVDPAEKFFDRLASSPGVSAAVSALTGSSTGAGAGGMAEYAGRPGASLISPYPGLGFDATELGCGLNLSKLAGLESLSERMSTVVKALTTLESVRSSPLFDATRLGLSSPPVNATQLGRGFEVIKWACVPTGLESVVERVSAAKPWMTSVAEASSGLTTAVQTAAQLVASSHVGELGLSAKQTMNWANEALARHMHGLSGLVGAVSTIAGQVSTFDRLMRESQRSMHEAVGRWDGPGHLAAMDQLMRQAQQSVGDTLGRWSMRDPAGWMNELMRGPAESITAMMRSWSGWAERGQWATRLALRMALRAKEAVKRGDLQAVIQFMREWLGFTRTPDDLVGSVSLVLLDERAWLPDDLLALDYDPCPLLRSLTLAEHRRLRRLVIDPRKRLLHEPVVSLDKPVTIRPDFRPPLLELVAAKLATAVDNEDDISDPRVLRVWGKLTEREREILREKGHPGMTWPAAAVACGGSPGEGERLRRKVKRLSKPADTPAVSAQAAS